MENHIIDDQAGAHHSESFNFQTISELKKLADWLRTSAIISIVAQGISFMVAIRTLQFSNPFVVILGVIMAIIQLGAATGLKGFCVNQNSYDFEKYGNGIRNYFLIIGILLILFCALMAILALVGIIGLALN